MEAVSKIIIIGGCPRSGTTLLQRILSLHPEVSGGPESGVLPAVAKLWRELIFYSENGKLKDYINPETIRENVRLFALSFFSEKMVKEGKSIISEKTPENVLYFPDLNLLFPDAYFIHIIRDPRDVIASMKGVLKRYQHQKKDIYPSYLNNIREAVSLWQTCISPPKENNISSNKNYMEIRYESLVANPRETIEKVCSYLGIDFYESMLNPEGNKSVFTKTSDEGSPWFTEVFKGPIQTTRTQVWKQALSFKELIWIEKTLTPFLLDLGYESDSNWLRKSTGGYLKYIPGKIYYVYFRPFLRGEYKIRNLPGILFYKTSLIFRRFFSRKNQ